MWRDLWIYAKAVVWRWASVATGVVVSLGLLISQAFDVAIPRWVFGDAAIVGVLVAGFLAWRDERRKLAPREVAPKEIDPDMELRRPQFEKEITKLTPPQEDVLRYVVQVGDADAIQLRERFFGEQGKSVSPHDADLLLTDLADARGLLEVKEKSNAYGRYRIKSVWKKLLIEWAAPPTPVDKRIADKAKALRRALAANFELWPQQNPGTLDDLVSWAHKVSRGYAVTEPAFRELVDLRAEASRRVYGAVGAARAAYDDATDIINPVVMRTMEIVGDQTNPARVAEATVSLPKAVGLVRECLAVLDRLTRNGL